MPLYTEESKAKMNAGSEADAIVKAKKELAEKMKKQQAEDAKKTAIERDRDQATRNAAASGDYKNGSYSPFHPDEK